MQNKLLSLLGIAKKAGRLTVGNDAVIETIRAGRSSLVLLANDLAPRTVRGIEAAALEYGIEVLTIPADRNELGMALGKSAGVVSVNDRGFSQKAQELCMLMNGEETKL